MFADHYKDYPEIEGYFGVPPEKRTLVGRNEIVAFIFKNFSSHLYSVAGGCAFTATIHDTVEDMVADAIIKVLQHIDQYRGDVHIKAWLGRIVKNAVVDSARKSQRRCYSAHLPIEKLLNACTYSNNPAEFVLYRELSLHFSRSDFVKIVYPYYIEGFSQREMADRLNMTVAAFRSEVHRLRARARVNFFVQKFGQ